MRKSLQGLAALLIWVSALWSPAYVAAWGEQNAPRDFTGADWHTYLPLVAHFTVVDPGAMRRVNVPHFSGSIPLSEMSVFWFGRVTPTDNYVDARMGYNAQELSIHLAVFDRRLWYNPDPTPSTLTAWDAASLYLNLQGNTGGVPTTTTYRFDAQLNDWETRGTRFQAAYRGNDAGWTAADLPFTTQTGYRWESATVGGLNNNANNRGWSVDFHIPFASLGLSGPPPEGSLWGLGVDVHDRDDASGAPIPDPIWPPTLATDQPETWGQLAFGAASNPPSVVPPSGVTTVRQGLNGTTVSDAMVGGGTVCGDGLDSWTQWGDKNYAGWTYLNVQNQADVADWPCFSKYYVTFPLGAIPANKVVLTATLTLYQFGNAGDATVPASFIQAMTASGNWSESTLTWNNAPQAGENLSGTWVSPLASMPPWPGVARTWNVGRAAAAAYAAGQPLRLVLYSADSAQHSGRYFTTSHAEDWDATGRPTLTVVWGNPGS
jgi:hypothetical protein